MINGIPLHPLIIHVVVVFIPLTAVFAAAALVPRWRMAMAPLAGLFALASVAGAIAARATGEQLLETTGSSPILERHEELAEYIVPLTVATAVFLVVAAVLHLGRPGFVAQLNEGALAGVPWVHTALSVVGLLFALASTVQVILIGDAGAQSVWLGG
ncbi:DUF2231 domain-containing protein [Zafaria sp. Z1313]|uniref:DUF2231 domain-containing protein n=1 Tax=unclassified Zafaria TaxID=2828765 RepID=UPI002E7898E6|nr:DUF2231 domain-containing protein [Zafaria sp. J156]MEE1619796.1 DUF2231 domain-containing protein [Zafaria sp. J156]